MRKHISNLASNIVFAIALFNVMVFFQFMWYGKIVWISYLLVLPFFLMYIVRHYSVNNTKIYFFTILNVSIILLTIGITAILSSNFIWVIFLVFLVAIMRLSLYIKNYGDILLRFYMCLFIVFANILLLIIVTNANLTYGGISAYIFNSETSLLFASTESFSIHLVITSLITIAATIININITNVDVYILSSSQKGLKNYEANHIIKSNNITLFFVLLTLFIAVFLEILFSVVLMFLDTTIHISGIIFGILANVLTYLINHIFDAILYLLSLIQRNQNDITPQNMTDYDQEISVVTSIFTLMDELPGLEYGLVYWILTIVSIVTTVFFGLFILSSLLLTAYHFFFGMFFNFLERHTSVVKYINNIINSKPVGFIINKRSSIQQKTLLKKIRLKYYKKVELYIKEGVDIRSHNTTDIIADKIKKYENINDLTCEYENARYRKD